MLLASPQVSGTALGYSVIVPCRNERGNIDAAVEHIPELGAFTEIIFVEGGSSDGTYEACLAAQCANPGRRIVVMRQPGSGKYDAVRAGFAAATGDVLAVLDADLTVAPAELPRFFAAAGPGTLVIGNRFGKAMERGAMPLLNRAANRFFAWWISQILGRPVRDALCGLKVIARKDFLSLAGRGYAGDADPFGDFSLLFGAVACGLRIEQVPVRYLRRRYGVTQIRRFRDGAVLAGYAWRAARRLRRS